MVIRAGNSGVGVAGLPWNQWLVCSGITGWFAAESVAGFPWNHWPVSRGIRMKSKPSWKLACIDHHLIMLSCIQN